MTYHRFKAGDKIKMTVDCSGLREGDIATVVDLGTKGLRAVATINGERGSCGCQAYWEPVQNEYNTIRKVGSKQLIIKS